MPETKENPLGAYLKERRTNLDPASLGFPLTRRRTPGLRREEVAQRASVSPTWYTWLEQGRGGAPSAEVLERIAQALLLTDIEREHLFLLALGRPPAAHYQPPDSISPRLQRVIDSMELCPAFIKTCTWDVLGWNTAARAVFAMSEGTMPAERNMLRRFFLSPHAREAQTDWESVARFVVAAFRADVARAGAANDVKEMVEELSRVSPEFRELWRVNDVKLHGDGVKVLKHPVAGLLSLEYSSFAVDGRPDLSMMIYSPATKDDAEKVRGLLKLLTVAV